MSDAFERAADGPACGTASCYELYRNRIKTAKTPYIECHASDFMVVSGMATFPSQLRTTNKRTVRPVDTSKPQKLAQPDYHGTIEWDGGSLDEEMYVIVGPN